MKSAPRRSRALKRAPSRLRPALAAASAPAGLHEALAAFAEEERAVLAMLLIERLTPADAAAALGIERARVVASYRSMLAALRRALRDERAPSRFGESRARIVLAPRRSAA